MEKSGNVDVFCRTRTCRYVFRVLKFYWGSYWSKFVGNIARTSTIGASIKNWTAQSCGLVIFVEVALLQYRDLCTRLSEALPILPKMK